MKWRWIISRSIKALFLIDNTRNAYDTSICIYLYVGPAYLASNVAIPHSYCAYVDYIDYISCHVNAIQDWTAAFMVKRGAG